MTQKSLYKRNKHIDVGGISCPCCTPMNTMVTSKAKRYVSGVTRVNDKQDLKKEVSEINLRGEEDE